MVNAYIYSVDDSLDGQRIDKAVCELCNELTRSAVQKLIEQGSVSINSSVVTKNKKVKSGDKISVIIPEATKIDETTTTQPNSTESTATETTNLETTSDAPSEETTAAETPATEPTDTEETPVTETTIDTTSSTASSEVSE